MHDFIFLTVYVQLTFLKDVIFAYLVHAAIFDLSSCANEVFVDTCKQWLCYVCCIVM